MIAIMMSSTY